MPTASCESCSSLWGGSFHSMTALPHPPCLSVPFNREEIHRQMPPQEHSWISQPCHSLWMLSLELTFIIRRKMIPLLVFVSIQMSFVVAYKCMKPFLLLAATTIFTSVPPLIALDAEISLNLMSTWFFSVTAVPSIKNFIHHLILLTLSDFTSLAEHKRKKTFTSSVSILQM